MKTTKTRTDEVTIAVTGPGQAVVNINGTGYLFEDEGRSVRVRKFEIQGGEEYRVLVGPKGCHSCNCPAGQYRRVARCRHEKAADLFLDEVF